MPPTPRVLSERALNRALLARQGLLERATSPLPRLLERVGGIQAQYAPSMYVGSWSRLEGFVRDDLTRALERRTVVQGTLMRATIHLVSARDYWPIAVAIGQPRRRWWLRAQRSGATGRDMARAAERLRRAIAGRVLTRREVEGIVGTGLVTGVGLWLDLVRVPPSGTWERRRADLFAAAEDWLGPRDPSLTVEAGRDLLVRRYLGGFGPATRNEIADFSGLSLADVAPSIDRLALRRLADRGGRELLDLPRAALPGADLPAPVRFLPTWDATLLAHARRTGILPERFRPMVFSTRTPHSVPTFLVDGSVVGSWRHRSGRVELSPFEPLPTTVMAEAEREAERLAAFHA